MSRGVTEAGWMKPTSGSETNGSDRGFVRSSVPITRSDISEEQELGFSLCALLCLF